MRLVGHLGPECRNLADVVCLFGATRGFWQRMVRFGGRGCERECERGHDVSITGTTYPERSIAVVAVSLCGDVLMCCGVRCFVLHGPVQKS